MNTVADGMEKGMNLEVKGIIIKTVDYKDSDKIVTILTDNMGKISAKAQGARRKGSRLTAAVQPFTYCSFQLFEMNGKYKIDEADVITQFLMKDMDIVKIALASYFCEIAAMEMENETADDSLLRLMLNSFYAIDNDIHTMQRIKSAFELKCSCFWGYAPQLVSDQPLTGEMTAISLEDGALASRNIFRRGVLLSRNALSAVNFIVNADLKKMLSFRIEKDDEDMLSRFCEGYMLDKIEYKPKTLGFYQSLEEM